ncbi:MAG: CBS domain-containing protein [Colwellia sp.]
MKIESLMSTKLVTLSMDESLSKAKEAFESNTIHHILITNDNKALTGIITDRDLYKHLSPDVGTSKETHRDTSLMQKKIHQIMARNIITARKNQSLNEAVLLFYDNHISCLPIVNNKNHILGIITWRDILKVIALQYKRKLAK